VGELQNWLLEQHPGLRTYKAFRSKALQLASLETGHPAIYKLLADMAGRHVAFYDEKPVPVDVAREAYEKLIAAVSDAERSLDLSADQQLLVLNRIAAIELS
jgi:hypothetical protein